MHRREVDFRRLDDVAQRHGIKPLLGEEPLRRVQNLRLGNPTGHLFKRLFETAVLLTPESLLRQAIRENFFSRRKVGTPVPRRPNVG